ncbi:hypothetical protein QZH41_017166 [Actinostola sp. cb2023]|nr:hypothetical protein QZH41_017166 [Actinostola sp. cb2023]
MGGWRKERKNFLQFVPLSSAVDAVFWHKLKDNKLNVYQLDDKPKSLQGYYVNSDLPGLSCRLSVDYNSFEFDCIPQRTFAAQGELINTNTMEDFRSLDKLKLIEDSGKKIWEAIKSKSVLDNPSLLCQFLLLTFAISSLQNSYEALCPEGNGPSFFLVNTNGNAVEISSLKEIDNVLKAEKQLMIGFSDPSTMPSHPGWQLRNFLYFISYHWGDQISTVEVLCFRDRFRGGKREISHSIIVNVSLPALINKDFPKCIGWEKNKNQKLVPRLVDLSATMDPEKLAESSVDLNLKLMRWRLLPSLDLEIVSQTRCLLLGSGTLGCNVARCLLGWGVRTITFVDYGYISYSNPVRQTLFEFEDCKGSGQPKAETAAKALHKIFPGVNSSGEMFSIPMPGHSIGSSQGEICAEEAVQHDVQRLEELIDAHDVVYLLMDTRESRWLPTLIAAAKKKLVITSALGFDTFLVMRHGAREVGQQEDLRTSGLGAIPGTHLGCYFCNDVVAPGNSMRDRTLDQQCTVSRPGISFIASALAVELMVSVLQHPQKGGAAANTSAKGNHLTAALESPLGLVPHQIRGFLSQYSTVLPASLAFNMCIACSDVVISSYMNEGFPFLLKAFNLPKYLEDLTGLTKLMSDTRVEEVWEMSDDETLED